jgi:rhomboid protease GluP
VLVAVHVVTALVVVRPGLPPWRVLLLPRSVAHRIAVGSQYAPLVEADPWRLCTSVLLHVDALHLFLNVTALLALGRLLEPRIGGIRWLAWLAIGGVGGSVTSLLVGVRQTDGASGAAFALLGAALVLGLRWRPTLSEDDKRLYGPVLGGFLLLNLVSSFVVPSINAAAHLGGLFTGLVLGGLPEHRAIRPFEAFALGLFVGACVFGWTIG